MFHGLSSNVTLSQVQDLQYVYWVMSLKEITWRSCARFVPRGIHQDVHFFSSDSGSYVLSPVQVDEIYIQSIKEAGLYDSIWQAFAVLLSDRTVGVQGDQRTHSRAVSLRAVTSEDGMTADW